ncbi:hypothetical protein CAEBREN_14509 [Caenorhabditis brenneri]|uniref:Uncharacterized protein n=1 Tax=Caenorhabditis brenneri TaxID=135651 RepID=G0MDF0_CAEBE|nr:hypothetical protein CAEBREN_14509 [Caenorhabditis brenneri]
MERQRHSRQCKAPRPPKPELERKTRSMTSTGHEKRKAASPSVPVQKKKVVPVGKKPTVPAIAPSNGASVGSGEWVKGIMANVIRSIEKEELERQMTVSTDVPSGTNHVRRATPHPNVNRKRHLGTSMVDVQVPVSSSQVSSQLVKKATTAKMRPAMANEQVPASSRQVSSEVLQERQIPASSSLLTSRFDVQSEVNDNETTCQNKKDKVERAANSYRARFTRPEEEINLPIDERPVGDVLRENWIAKRYLIRNDTLEKTNSQTGSSRQPPEVSKMTVPIQNKLLLPVKTIQRPPLAIISSRPVTSTQRLIPGRHPGTHSGQLVSRKEQPVSQVSTFSKAHPLLAQLLTAPKQQKLAVPGPQETPTVPAQCQRNQNTLPTHAPSVQEVDILIEDVPSAQTPNTPPVQNKSPKDETPGDESSHQLAYLNRAIRAFGSSVPAVLPVQTRVTVKQVSKNLVAQEPPKSNVAIKEEPVEGADFNIIKHKSSPSSRVPTRNIQKRLPEAKKLILPTGCKTNYEEWTDENCQEFILKFVESDDFEQIDIINRLSIDSSALEALTETDDWEKLRIKYKIFCKLRSHFNKVVNVQHGFH